MRLSPRGYPGAMGAPEQEFWSRFGLDPRVPAHQDLRAGDPDREIVQQALGEAYSLGRLTREEHDERSEYVAGGRTLGELVWVLRDLVSASSPPFPPAPPDDGRWRDRAEALVQARIRRQWTTAALVLTAVGLLLATGRVGATFFVVLTVLLAGRALRTTARRPELVLARERSLQRHDLAHLYRRRLDRELRDAASRPRYRRR